MDRVQQDASRLGHLRALYHAFIPLGPYEFGGEDMRRVAQLYTHGALVAAERDARQAEACFWGGSVDRAHQDASRLGHLRALYHALIPLGPYGFGGVSEAGSAQTFAL